MKLLKKREHEELAKKAKVLEGKKQLFKKM